MLQTNPKYLSIARYLTYFRCHYPGILEWFSGLENELANGRRRILVSWKGSEVQGLAITKNGPKAKLCHISVSPVARDRGIGRTLMSLALCDMVYHGAQEIRVTTSEEVFREHAPFFRAAGFEVIDWQVHRYRRGISEIIWKLEINPSLCHFIKSTSGYSQHNMENDSASLLLGRPTNVSQLPYLLDGEAPNSLLIPIIEPGYLRRLNRAGGCDRPCGLVTGLRPTEQGAGGRLSTQCWGNVVSPKHRASELREIPPT
jgi:hypothetical protein